MHSPVPARHSCQPRLQRQSPGSCPLTPPNPRGPPTRGAREGLLVSRAAAWLCVAISRVTRELQRAAREKASWIRPFWAPN